MRICMIAADNPHYTHSLVQGLSQHDLEVDLIGGDYHLLGRTFPPQTRCLNLRGSHDSSVSPWAKIVRLLLYYGRCCLYMMRNRTRIVHVQGFRFALIEGVVLLLLYRLMGKKIVYTAHNTQPKGKQTVLKHWIFSCICRIAHRIICHTNNLKAELIEKYGLPRSKVSVVRHGLNCTVPVSSISAAEAREKLGLPASAKVLLIFGGILPYKGVHIALAALKELQKIGEAYTLVIAGGGGRNDSQYLNQLSTYMQHEGLSSAVTLWTDYIEDEDVELFFNASDVLLLPYTEGHFQSGVLFLAYRFGLPVIASDLETIREDVDEGVQGYLFQTGSADDLTVSIRRFYAEMATQDSLRTKLQEYAARKYDWRVVAQEAIGIYRSLSQSGTAR